MNRSLLNSGNPVDKIPLSKRILSADLLETLFTSPP